MILTGAIARISCSEPFLKFHCPACGAPILVNEEGLAGSYCEHVVFITDWTGETFYGEKLDSEMLDALQEAVENNLEATAALLPASSVIFELTETPRGGGHDGSEITFAIDFCPANGVEH